jgi:hypothetical protein
MTASLESRVQSLKSELADAPSIGRSPKEGV